MNPPASSSNSSADTQDDTAVPPIGSSPGSPSGHSPQVSDNNGVLRQAATGLGLIACALIFLWFTGWLTSHNPKPPAQLFESEPASNSTSKKTSQVDPQVVNTGPPNLSSVESHKPARQTDLIGRTPSPLSATIKVHVTGQVGYPGVYDMPPGSRVLDAIQRAGGALPNGDVNRLNLAARIQDGTRIEVPTINKINNGGTTAATPSVETAKSTPASTPSPENPLDLNNAIQAELETLPGIGPLMAQRIIDYRTRVGRFKSVQELDNVPGIGGKTLEKLHPLVVAL